MVLCLRSDGTPYVGEDDVGAVLKLSISRLRCALTGRERLELRVYDRGALFPYATVLVERLDLQRELLTLRAYGVVLSRGNALRLARLIEEAYYNIPMRPDESARTLESDLPDLLRLLCRHIRDKRIKRVDIRGDELYNIPVADFAAAIKAGGYTTRYRLTDIRRKLRDGGYILCTQGRLDNTVTINGAKVKVISLRADEPEIIEIISDLVPKRKKSAELSPELSRVLTTNAQHIQRCDIAGKEDLALDRIRLAHEIGREAGNDLIVAYCGGKDSDVLLSLARKAGVPFRAEHNHTTADAPETVRYIREVFDGLTNSAVANRINAPSVSMWALIANNLMPPTRQARYCCDALKERTFDGQHILTGVRRDESHNREARGEHEVLSDSKSGRIVYYDTKDSAHRIHEICQLRGRMATNPIVDWTTEDVWDYIRQERLRLNPLYSEGFKRVGCVGCPLAGKHRYVEFERYPKYRAAYIRAFDRMLARRRELGKDVDDNWRDGAAVFEWWIT